MKFLYTILSLCVYLSIQAMEEAQPVPELPHDMINIIASLLPRTDDVPQLQNLLTPFAQTNKTNLDLARKIYHIKKSWIIPKLSDHIKNYIIQFLPAWQNSSHMKSLLKAFACTSRYNRDLAQFFYKCKHEQIKHLHQMFNEHSDPLLHLDLIRKGVNHHYGFYTPLSAAANRNEIIFVNLLLQAGASVGMKSKWSDETPLLTALCHRADNDLINLLITNSCQQDINEPDKYGWTPLILAVSRNQPEIVSALLAKGADTEVKHLTKTALLWALDCETHNDAFEVIKLLLDHGADVNTKDGYHYLDNVIKFGEGALRRAKKGGNKAIIDLLINHGARE